MAVSQTALEITKKTSTKILTNVTGATIDLHWRDRRKFSYISMVVPTGDAAPTNTEILTNGRLMFADGTQEVIESSVGSPLDVYVYCNREGISFASKKGLLVLTVDQ